MKCAITKIDLAAREPAALAGFLARVFAIEFREVTRRGMPHFSGYLGAIELFICPRAAAGIAEDAAGVHQLHIVMEGDIAPLLQRAKELGAETMDNVGFEPGQAVSCLWDPDGNPWVIRGS